jgi:hypothetical protein
MLIKGEMAGLGELAQEDMGPEDVEGQEDDEGAPQTPRTTEEDAAKKKKKKKSKGSANNLVPLAIDTFLVASRHT